MLSSPMNDWLFKHFSSQTSSSGWHYEGDSNILDFSAGSFQIPRTICLIKKPFHLDVLPMFAVLNPFIVHYVSYSTFDGLKVYMRVFS